MVSKIEKKDHTTMQGSELDVKNLMSSELKSPGMINLADGEIKTLCDDNLIMLKKVHPIISRTHTARATLTLYLWLIAIIRKRKM